MMSTKILCWNIERFGDQKMIGGEAQDSEFRRNYILSNITINNPDIFVVIEVVCNKGKAGSIIDTHNTIPFFLPNGTSSYLGVHTLLSSLRSLDEEWYLVPPLRLSTDSAYSETIAVYYKGSKLEFIGPYVWPDGEHYPDKVSKPDGNSGPYPENFKYFLPPPDLETKIYYAAQVEFKTNSNTLLFPDKDSRNPYLTRFRERYGAKRTISLFNIHLPVNPDRAEKALKRLLNHINQEFVNSNDIKVIAGDLNIDLAENFGLNRQISELGYRIGINPRPHEKDKIKTIFKKTDEAIPLLPPLISGYTTSFVDNFIIKGAQNHNPDIVSKTINRVFTGTDKRMYDTLEDIMRIGDIDARYEKFRNYENYGHIRHTSDHMPILLEI